MTIRAFLAFDISDTVVRALAKVIDDFQKKSTGVKWIPAENMHVTMKFFGNIDEDFLLGDISNEISDITKHLVPVTLDCAGVGVFPNWKYPRVIWAGFMGDADPILALQANLEKALEKFRIEKDKRAFRLHLTIGRADEIKSTSFLAHLIEGLGPIDFGKVKIDHLTLYKSTLTKTGAVYSPIKRFDFGGRK